MKKKRKTMGRPRVEFSWQVLDALSTHGATEVYIAEYMLRQEGAIPDSKTIRAKVQMIQRRIRERFDVTFAEYKEQKLDSWRVELAQLQRKAARAGNPTMLVWLGKQHLEQKDKNELTGNLAAPATVIVNIPANGTEKPKGG